MIDYCCLLLNSSWVIGLSVVLAVLSFASYQVSRKGSIIPDQRHSLGRLLAAPRCQRTLALALVLVCLGLLFSAGSARERLHSIADAQRWATGEQPLRTVADVNGDGRADLIGFGREEVVVALSTASRFGEMRPWTRSFTAGTGEWTDQDRYPRLMGDVNGDGRADIIGFIPDEGVLVALSAGDRFGKPRWWSRRFGGWSSQGQRPRLMGDVNGDGRADIVGIDPAKGVLVALSTGSSFGKPQWWSREFRGGSSQVQYPRMVADTNGDGRADIVEFGDRGVLVALSTGNSFDKSRRWTGSYKWSGEDPYPRLMGDVNGDNKADIVTFRKRGVWVSLATTDHFGRPRRWTRDFGWSVENPYLRMMGDTNGDGRADLIGFGQQRGVGVALSTANGFGEPELWSHGFGPPVSFP